VEIGLEEPLISSASEAAIANQLALAPAPVRTYLTAIAPSDIERLSQLPFV